MVDYWRHGDVARAKIVHDKDGSLKLMIEGEKYLYPGFPRGHVLTGPLEELKTKIKNLVFNNTWQMIAENKSPEEILQVLESSVFPELLEEIKKSKLDMTPIDKCVAMVREIWRAWSEVERKITNTKDRENFRILKEGITFFFQEDDAYRFRVQWMAKYANPKSILNRIYGFLMRRKGLPIKEISHLLKILENAEVVPDMKARINLIKTVFLIILQDQKIKEFMEAFYQELNWKKLYLSKADKYYFRGKYFKVEHDHFDY